METFQEFTKEKKCWKQLISTKTNKFYFLNIETGETQWNFPDTFEPLTKDWKKYISKNIKPMGSYYINTISGEKTWNRPIGTPDSITDNKILPKA
jgi:outer membrane protein assembly factor BamB